jgi:hypothetical protein
MSERAMEYLEGLDQHTRSMVENMMVSIYELGNNYIDFVRNFNGENGFMFSGGNKMNNIMNTHRVIKDGHSGSSAGGTLRTCQYMLENFPINDIETGLYHSSDDDEPETTSVDEKRQSAIETPHELAHLKGIYVTFKPCM